MSQTMEAVDRPALSLLWRKHTIQEMAQNISPRLSRLVTTVAHLLANPAGSFTEQEHTELEEAFSELEYVKSTGSGPICRLSDDTVKYYRCYTCQLIRGTVLCEQCFSDPKHAGHEFKIVTHGPFYCDCGNQEFLPRASFCRIHSHDHESRERRAREAPRLSKLEAEIFSEEMEFLLCMGLQSKLLSEEATQEKGEEVGQRVLETLTEVCSNSYNYQQLAGQLLLKAPRSCFKMESSSLLHQYLWANWDTEAFMKMLVKLLFQLYSHEAVRPRILIEYLSLHTAGEHYVSIANPLTEIDSHYFLEGKTILRLLKAKQRAFPLLALHPDRLPPLKFLPACHLQIFRAYRIMAETTVFPQILAQTLKGVNFSLFFSFAAIESRSTINIVSRGFLGFLRLVVKTLRGLRESEEEETRKIEEKVIREVYQYLKSKEETFNFCPQRTLSWFIFAYYNSSLPKMLRTLFTQFMALLGESSLSSLMQVQQRTLECFFNLLRIQNFNDYRQLTGDSKLEINASNRVVVALDYLCVRMALCVLGTRAETVVRHCAVGKLAVLEKWVHLYRIDQIKRDSIVDPDARAHVATLLETGLFIRPLDQIAGTTIEVVAVFNNLLFACESHLCELVLAHQLGDADREKVLELYREIAWLHPTKTRAQMKAALEQVLADQALIKAFILEEHEGFFRGQRSASYRSNLSYCSRFFGDELNDDTTQRFLKKLATPALHAFSQLALSEVVVGQLLRYGNNFLRFITGLRLELNESSSIAATFNLLLETLIVLYTEVRDPRLLSVVQNINTYPNLTALFTEYSKLIMRTFTGFLSTQEPKQQRKDEGEPKKEELAQQEELKEDGKKETARLKKEEKMRRLKETQQKFLQQHLNDKANGNGTADKREVSSSDQNLCIICKSPSGEDNPLSYLCLMRFSNILASNMLRESRLNMIITTCGHTIHERCLFDSLDQHDQYGSKYHCFLCRQVSNLRIPLLLHRPDSFLEFLLTVMTLELAANPATLPFHQQYTTVMHAFRLLHENLTRSIFYYYFHVGKFYLTSVLPIVKTQLALLRWMLRNHQIEIYTPLADNATLRIVEEKVYWLITREEGDTNDPSRHFGNEFQRLMLDQLFSKVLGNDAGLVLKEVSAVEGLGFLQLPRDLRVLSRQMGRCMGCQRFTNQALACFFCGDVLCINCTGPMNHHVDRHLGIAVLIDYQSGRYSYRYRNIQLAFHSLYTNYVGQEFSSEAELPAEGQYQLSQERLEKMLDEVLRETVGSTVQQYLQAAEGEHNCNVQ